MSRRSKLAHAAPAAAAYVCVVWFYFWTACTSGAPFKPAPVIYEHYSLLAAGYVSGQLSLSVAPPAALLALPDPYNPAANAHLRLHDAALYNGRYYLYFGPTPALLLLAPFRLATSLDFPQSLSTALFSSVGLLFAFLLLRFLCDHFMSQPPSAWWLTACMLALGFCGTLPFLLRRPAMYEVAISCGYALVMASLYCFVTGGLVCRPRLGRLAMGSALLGLAGGARFPLLAAGLAPLGLAVFLMRTKPAVTLRRRVGVLAGLFVPVAVGVVLLGWYNYARFGSWTEFGIRYTLQGVHPGIYEFFSLQRLGYGLAYYTIVPVSWSAVFPFAQLNPAQYLVPPPYLYVEPAAGMLAHSPLLVILAASPWLRPSDNRLAAALAVSLLLGSSLLLLFSITGTTMRYEVDFVTFFVLPALVVWRQALNSAGASPAAWQRWLTRGAFLMLLSVGVLTNLFISFTGYYDNLKLSYPRTYDAVHDLFRPVERLLDGPLTVVRMDAPGGVRRLQGESFFWLGGPPAEIVLQSTRRRTVEFSATFAPGPSGNPSVPTRTVRVEVPSMAWSTEIQAGAHHARFHVPLGAGETTVRLLAGSATTAPNGDPAPRVVGVRGLRIDRVR